LKWRGFHKLLKNARLVSGHSFSDAVTAAESLPSSGAATRNYFSTARKNVHAVSRTGFEDLPSKH